MDCEGKGCWGMFEALDMGEVGFEVATRFNSASREMPISIKFMIFCLASLRTSAGASLMAPVIPEATEAASPMQGVR